MQYFLLNLIFSNSFMSESDKHVFYVAEELMTLEWAAELLKGSVINVEREGR